jgi:hypothetical protein
MRAMTSIALGGLQKKGISPRLAVENQPAAAR